MPGIMRRPAAICRQADSAIKVSAGVIAIRAICPRLGKKELKGIKRPVTMAQKNMAKGWRMNSWEPSMIHVHPAVIGSVAACIKVNRQARQTVLVAQDYSGKGVMAALVRRRRIRSKWRGSCGLSVSAGRGIW